MILKLNNKGLTLIEILISILILAIMMAGGMSFYFNADNMMALAIHKKVALEVAANTLETIKGNGGYSDPTLPLTGTCNALTVVTIGLDYQPSVCVNDIDEPIPAGNGSVDFKQVKAIVTWNQSGAYSPSGSVDLTTSMAP